jgi:malonate decarboxylase beta subunit
VQAFRNAAIELMHSVPGFGIEVLNAEQSRLELRLQRFGACRDALEIWAAEGIRDAGSIPALTPDQFIALADSVRPPHLGAR